MLSHRRCRQFLILRPAAQLSSIGDYVIASAFGIGLIVPVRAQIHYPKIAKFRLAMVRGHRRVLELALLASQGRDLAGFEGIDNRLAIVIRGKVPIPDALGEDRQSAGDRRKCARPKTTLLVDC